MDKKQKTTKRGPKADRGELKDAILDAAQQLFASQGFAETSTKNIAEAAKVDKKLLHYYFGTKDALFTAMLERAFNAIEGRETLTEALNSEQHATISHYLTRILNLMEDPSIGPALIALLRSVSTYPPAAQAYNAFIQNTVLSIAKNPEEKETQIKLFLVGSHIYGLLNARYILRVPLATELTIDEIVARFAPIMHMALSTK